MNKAILFFFFCAWLLVGCAAAPPPVVKIGLVGPFEGRYRAVGYDTIYSARALVRETNERGKIGPYRVALAALDDSGDPELAAQTAASLALDPGVMAVVGHWLPETTAAAAPIYREAGLPLIAGGLPPFAAAAPEQLPEPFFQLYSQVTPFDESPGPYAGPAYDALWAVVLAIELSVKEYGRVDRETIALSLPRIEFEGYTGPKSGIIEKVE